MSDGCDGDLIAALKAAALNAGAKFEVIAPTVYGVTTAGGDLLPADHKVEGGPSVLFDAVAIVPSAEGGAKLAMQAEAVNFLRDAYGHLKVVAYLPTAAPLFVKGGISDRNPDNDAGLISLATKKPGDFVTAASGGRIWAREPTVRLVV